jgi:hypothetical protein
MSTYRVKNLVPIASEVVDISVDSHTFTAVVHALRSDEAGTVIAKLRDDAAARTFTVAAGEVLVGQFTSVTKTGTTVTTAGALVGFVLPLE